MNRLEYHILTLLQAFILGNLEGPRYIELDDHLIAVIKGSEGDDLYVQTECILEGRSAPTFSFQKISGELYKIEWTSKFKYLVGEIDSGALPPSFLTKELELIQSSGTPLSNYIKTL